MGYLQGEQIKIDTPTLNKMIGVKVEYLLKRDISKFNISPRYGVVTEIIRRQVDLGNGCHEPFSAIQEIVLR